MEEFLKPVIELSKKAKTYDEFKNQLEELYPKMNSDQLENLATKAFFISALDGKLSVQKER